MDTLVVLAIQGLLVEGLDVHKHVVAASLGFDQGFCHRVEHESVIWVGGVADREMGDHEPSSVGV